MNRQAADHPTHLTMPVPLLHVRKRNSSECTLPPPAPNLPPSLPTPTELQQPVCAQTPTPPFRLPFPHVYTQPYTLAHTRDRARCQFQHLFWSTSTRPRNLGGCSATGACMCPCQKSNCGRSQGQEYTDLPHGPAGASTGFTVLNLI
jgi:hypothetical protein